MEVNCLLYTYSVDNVPRLHFNERRKVFPILLVADLIRSCNYRSDSGFHPPVSYLAVFITVLWKGATESFPDIIRQHFLIVFYCQQVIGLCIHCLFSIFICQPMASIVTRQPSTISS